MPTKSNVDEQTDSGETEEDGEKTNWSCKWRWRSWSYTSVNAMKFRDWKLNSQSSLVDAVTKLINLYQIRRVFVVLNTWLECSCVIDKIDQCQVIVWNFEPISIFSQRAEHSKARIQLCQEEFAKMLGKSSFFLETFLFAHT